MQGSLESALDALQSAKPVSFHALEYKAVSSQPVHLMTLAIHHRRHGSF